MLKNFYETLPNEFKNKTLNPGYGKTHFFENPGRILLVGASGSGKSNALLNLIKAMNDTFTHITLCVKNKDEPLYNFLVKKLKDQITVYDHGEVPDLKDIKKDGNNTQLFIFDDLVTDSAANKKIEEYFKMGRKKNLFIVYCSQSYFKTPKFFRQNLTGLILRKVSNKRDLRLILSDFPLPLNINQLEHIYNQCTKNFTDILIINNLTQKLYHNFTREIQI